MTKIRIAQQNVDTFSLVSPRVHYILLTFRWEWLPRHCDHCWIIILPKKMLVCTFKKKTHPNSSENPIASPSVSVHLQSPLKTRVSATVNRLRQQRVIEASPC
jgi:hypothetical protein